MRKLLAQSLKYYWDSVIFGSLKVRDVFHKIFYVFSIFESMKIARNSTVAIYSKLNLNWIIAYLTSILYGVKILILNSEMELEEVYHALLINRCVLLFTDKEDEDWLGSAPSINIIVNTRTDKLSIMQSNSVFKQLALSLNMLGELKNQYFTSKDVDKLIDMSPEWTDNKDDILFISPTSGVSEYEIKYVATTKQSVLDTLLKLNKSFPLIAFDKVGLQLDAVKFHIVSILYPILTGCSFVTSQYDANVLMNDTQNIKNVWKIAIANIYSSFFLSFLMKFNWIYKLFFNKLVEKQFKKMSFSNKKAIIIFNNTCPLDLNEYIIQSNLPFISTYGSEELNQIAFINDYSTKDMKNPYCVGKPLPGIDFTISSDNILFVSTSSVFSHYVNDLELTKNVKTELGYNTKDFARSNRDLLFVEGRQIDIIKPNGGKINLYLLKKVFESISFVDNAEFILTEENVLFVIIELNNYIMDALNYSFGKAKRKLKEPISTLERYFKGETKVFKDPIIVPSLEKTFDGKVNTHLYRVLV